MKKFFKALLCLGLIGVGAVVAVQYRPVREKLKELGLPL